MCIEINGHRVVELVQATMRGFFGTSTVCFGCGHRFIDRLDLEEAYCPAADLAHGHHLVSDVTDGLLYCRRCPLVAYDLSDVATESACPA